MNIVWIDYVIIGIIALSLLSGFIRGFFREFLSFMVWVVALVITINYYPYFIKYITFFSEELLKKLSAIGLLFIGVLFFGTIAAHLVSRFVSLSAFSGTDRLLGIIFGIFRGVVVTAVLIVLIQTFTSLPTTEEWKQSVLLPYFNEVVRLGTNYFQNRYM